MNRSDPTRRIATRYVRAGPYDMFMREAGSAPGAPTIVLVHGFLVSSRYMTPLLHALAPSCRGLAPDLPGWGHSSKPSRHRSLTLEGMADALVQWMEVVGAQRPVLLGNSFGCQIIVEAATRHPQRLAAAVLLGPTVDPAARSTLHQAYRLALDVPRERPSLWLVELVDLWHKGLSRTWRELRVMMDDRIEERLPRVECPALVVRGSRDPIVPSTWAEEAARLLPRGSLLTLPAAPHSANYSRPEQLAEAILPFVSRYGSPAVREPG